MEQKDYRAAIGDFSELIRLAPMNPTAYELRAEALEALGDADAAADDRKKAEAFGSRVGKDGGEDGGEDGGHDHSCGCADHDDERGGCTPDGPCDE